MIANRFEHGLSLNDLTRAVEALRQGRVVAAATESFFALMVDAHAPKALDALFALKGRAPTKGVGLMVPDEAAWRALVGSVPASAQALARAFWPGPLTLVLPAAIELDPRVQATGTVAVRVPGPSPAAAIVAAFGGPVTATSANLAGEPPCAVAGELRRALAVDAAAVLVVGPNSPGGPVSTLVRVRGDDFDVLRPGAVSDAQLRRAVADSP